jgi:hypothetical protein
MLKAILEDGMIGWVESQAFEVGHAKFQLSAMNI